MQGQGMIFAAVFSIAVLFFIWSCWYRFRLVALGRPDNRFDHLGRRTWNMLFYAFGQRRVVTRSYPFGLNHFVFFWCFIILLIANGSFPAARALSPIYIAIAAAPSPVLRAGFYLRYRVAAGAAGRHHRHRQAPALPAALHRCPSADAFVILGLVAILMLAFFGLNGSEIALGTVQTARLHAGLQLCRERPVRVHPGSCVADHGHRFLVDARRRAALLS